jgi:hypothetical protein
MSQKTSIFVTDVKISQKTVRSVVSTTGSHGRQSRFSRPELSLVIQSVLIYPHEAELAPFHIHSLSENLVAPGIETGTSGSAARKTTDPVLFDVMSEKYVCCMVRWAY